MFRLLLLTATFCAAPTAPQPAAIDHALVGPSPRLQARPMPVHIVDSDSHPAAQPPMVVIGSLFTGGYCFREDDAGTVHRTPQGQITLPVRLTGNQHSKVAQEYLLGNVRPRPACNEEETCVFVTSPALNGYEEFRIDSIQREGNRIAMLASYWHDDSGRRWGPGPNHSAQIVRLGRLEPGDYTFTFVLRDRFCTGGPKLPSLFADRTPRAGETTFTVAQADAWNFHTWDQPPSTAVIHEKDLQGALGPSPVDPPLYQLPYFSYRLTSHGAAKAEAATVVMAAPRLDWHKHSQQSETLWEPARVEEPAPTDQYTLVAHISGGTPQILGKHDWAEISSVEWKGTNVTVHANIWRKPYIRGNDTVRAVPSFALPLESGHLNSDLSKALASVKVRVVWQEGVDNPHNAVEEVRH